MNIAQIKKNTNRSLDLPHSTAAECAVIGSIFSNPNVVHGLSGKLNPEHFYSKKHQALVETIVQLATGGVPPDFVSVFESLKTNGHSEFYPDFDQLHAYLDFATYPENIFHYLQEIQKWWEIRQLVTTCAEVAQKGRTVGKESAQHFLEEIEKTFLQISQARVVKGLIPASDIVKETMVELEELVKNPPQGVTGVATGFRDLDNITAGFQRSDLIILAARPAMGKTALVLNFATHAAVVEKKRVAFFSLEMSRTQLIQRVLATAARLQAHKFRSGKISAEEFDRLYPEAARLQTDHLMIDDTPALSLFELSSRCRKMKREKGACDLIIVDYLQLMTADVGKKNNFNREREISSISMGLKALAKEINCPVLACAQINRSVEQRPDKRPKPSDLRESGSIEQDADMVMFIYRDEVYNSQTTLDKGIAELIIAKNRHGACDTVKLAFLQEFTSFHNLAKESF